ncbi:PhzF family phenazine biosynthesis protein [Clostridium sp. DJ247]|uniref:PhzF family phenazine biosynthesis protein n=1 Tax=Clostridium sp. DJ247 TaxID=2726188 RepID=UPI00162431DB|nr:PhzF family phenazine biosynthesis isomerase [Clostridium sp. DJ247]MBC2581089.1 PhzF family phenazine biosynthesis protein [Clostridium sp. DJ247]
MKSLQFKKIDAFTMEGSSGNPAGCIYLENKIEEEEMQKIARELKGAVNEVVYCLPITSNNKTIYLLLYYSSECEVEFCGHGTIACMYDLIFNTPELFNEKEITIRTNKGDLQVFNNISSMDAVFITAPLPEYKGTTLTAKEISENLNISDTCIDSKYPIDLINAGLNTLIVPINSLQNVISTYPDIDTLKNFCIANGIDIITIFTMDVSHNANKLRTRVFAPKYGYLEDPATGSGNSSIGYYLLKNKLWEGDPMSIEQGPSSEIPNIVKLDTIINDGVKRILFGGKATVRIEREYLLH